MFGFGKKEAKDEIKILRENNLKDLKLAYSSIRKILKDDSIWELLFSLPSSNQFCTLKITLAPDFPIIKPIMQVIGPLNHMWLDTYKNVTGCPMLNNWTKESSLRDVTHHVLTGLKAGSTYYSSYPAAAAAGNNPSINSNQVDVHLSGIAENKSTNSLLALTPPSSEVKNIERKSISSSSGNISNTQYHDNLATTSRTQSTILDSPRGRGESLIAMPDIPSSFPILKQKSDIELRAYMNDPDAFQELIKSLSIISGMVDIRDEVRDSNAKQAELTLEKGQFINLHNEVTDLQKLVKNQAKSYQDMLDATKSQHCVPSTLIKLKLKERRDAMEMETDNLAKRFTSGDCDMKTFLKEYKESRQEFHSLDCKFNLLSQPFNV